MAVSLNAATAGQLRIHLLGGMRLQVGDHALSSDWRLRKSAHLVAMLALAPEYRLHREHLLDALWPAMDPVAASNNLAQALMVARRAIDPVAGLGGSCLKREGETLVLRPPGGLWLDVDDFTAAVAAARLSQSPEAHWKAADLYGGDLLPEEPYADWVAGRRETLRQTYVDSLLALGRLHEHRGEPEQALMAAQRLLATEPAHESAHRLVMTAFRHLGQTDQAMRQYEALRETLARELDAEPDAISQHLFEQILTDRQHVQKVPDSTSMVAAPKLASSASLPSSRTNLPHQLTSFIGREDDLADVRRRLTDTRLLTLTGSGGVGKTRLALAAADAAGADFPDGVWLIEFAPLADPALVPNTVALALSIAEQPGRSTLDTVRGALTSKRLLLVLDNCEHLIDACANLVEALLGSCPAVTILAASRERLGLAGEVLWRVPPLGVPDSLAADPVAAVTASEAGQLFVERARLAEPTFEVMDKNAASVTTICMRLDGIPLALELAAARVSLLPVDQIADRLGDALRLLTSGSRTAPLHQRTLRATLDWSYALLTESEQVLLRRLAIFAGGWTLEAAEVVAAGEGIEPDDVLDLLGQVVYKSLAQMDQREGESRYRLLETVRQYAGERLLAMGEEQIIQHRHAAWCLALAERAEPALRTSEQLVWLARLDAEHDNLRAALTWCLDHQAETGLHLAGILWPFWRGRRHYSEGRRWLKRLLDCAPTPTRWRAKALLGAGRLAFEQGDLTMARARLDESLILGRAQAEARLVAWALRELAEVSIQLGDLARARMEVEEGLALCRTAGEPADLASTLITLGRLETRDETPLRARAVLEEGLALARLVGDRLLIGDALGWLAMVACLQGDYRRARALAEEALIEAEEMGAAWLAARLHWQLANVAFHEGDQARATALYGLGLAEARKSNDSFWLAFNLLGLGDQARVQGDPARATSLLEEALDLFTARADQVGAADAGLSLGLAVWQEGDAERATALLRASLASRHAKGRSAGISQRLEALATVAAGMEQCSSDARRAARLFGAAAALRQRIGAPLPPVDRPGYEAALATCRAALGDAAFQSAWAAGEALTLEQAVNEALSPYPFAEPGHIEPANLDRIGQPAALPASVTSFIGRERDVMMVSRQLTATRLLTLTGTGGVGKTRLALEVARTVAADYPDGVFLVELAALADPNLVPQAVARALKVDERHYERIDEPLVARLVTKRLLIVIDNCEHLIAPCASLVDTVLRGCPDVRVLATSREALRLGGELVWRVPSLAVPNAQERTSVTRVMDANAVKLFAERARFVQPSFTISVHNAEVVARICTRLDGIPLALELAAARLNALSIDEIDGRLKDVFRLLIGGSRAALPRQQALRATLDWSHDLLTVNERMVLRRLAVFAGGWTLDAAEAVCGVPEIAAADVLDVVAGLVDKSLAQAEPSVGATRYRLLETVRQYAWERMDAADETALTRDRHAAWCLALAERADPELRSHDQLRWLARLDTEHDNCRAALAWLLDRDPTDGLRLAAALGWYWWVRAFLREGRQWLDTFLARAPERTQARVWALHGAGRLARHLGDWYAPRSYWEAALELGRDLESTSNVAWVVRDLGLTMHDMGHVAVARSLLEEGLILARQVGDRRGEGVALDFLGRVLLQSTIERGRGQALLEESLAVLRQVGDRWALSGLLDSLAVMNWSLGDYERAGAQAAEGLSIAIEIGAPIRIALFQSMLGQLAYVTGDGATALRHFDLAMPREQLEVSWVAVTLSRTALVACQVGETARAEALARESMALLDAQYGPGTWAWPSYVLGRVALRRADFVAATDLLREALRQWRALTDDVGIAPTLEPLAQAALGQGLLVRAARLLGAADALRRQLDAPLPPVERPNHEATLAAVRMALGPSAFQEAFDDGARLTLDKAVAEALASLPPTQLRHEELTTRR